MEFQYEKLPDFCFHYGLLGHTQKDCDANGIDHGDQYGAWLRANHSINLHLAGKTIHQKNVHPNVSSDGASSHSLVPMRTDPIFTVEGSSLPVTNHGMSA